MSQKTKIDYQQAVIKSKKILIDYKKLRAINPEAARTAVLDYLASNGSNISDCAVVFGLQRVAIYAILKKASSGNLKDSNKRPKISPKKTDPWIEEKVVDVQNRTGFGPKRLMVHLRRQYGIRVAYGTIRHILGRNRHRLVVARVDS